MSLMVRLGDRRNRCLNLGSLRPGLNENPRGYALISVKEWLPAGAETEGKEPHHLWIFRLRVAVVSRKKPQTCGNSLLGLAFIFHVAPPRLASVSLERVRVWAFFEQKAVQSRCVCRCSTAGNLRGALLPLFEGGCR